MSLFELLQAQFIQNAFFAGSLVALVAAITGYFIVIRGLTFAGHALSHIGFAGAAGAVLLGVEPVFGLLLFTICAGISIGVLGKEVRERDIAIGIIMTLGLGLGILFLSLYQGYAEQAYSILFGTIVGISRLDVLVSAIFSVLVFVTLLVIFRPLLFSSLDPEVAEARGVPVRFLSVVFMLLLAITISEAVQVVGVLLVFALLVAPAAAAERLTKRPFASILLAVFLGLLFTWAGLLLTFLTRWPASFYIAAFAALSYLSAVVFDRVHSPRRYKEPPHPSRECIDSSHIPHHA